MVFPDALKITILRENGEQENFLMSVNRHREVCHSFDNLRNEIVARHPELLQLDEVKFFWIDDEKDEITILNHADYFDYMDSNLGPSTAQKRRIYVKGVRKPAKSTQETDEAEAATPSGEEPAAPIRVGFVDATDGNRTGSVPPENLPVHTNIVCDVCDETIRGHRYKCLQCFNYDLCMRCEAKFRHKDHLAVRIPTPEQGQRSAFRLFERLRNYAAEFGPNSQSKSQSQSAAEGTSGGPGGNDYENSKRTKRHHCRHGKDREESKERREEKERKERKHRRGRSFKDVHEEYIRNAPGTGAAGCHWRRSGGLGPQITQLLNKVIDPANIEAAFLSADAAAAAAAAAAESASEAVRGSMANCPMFAAASTTTASSATATADAEMNAPEVATASTSEEPQAKKAAPSADQENVDNGTPIPDLSWLAPTAERINKINQTFSRILDPLGMNIEIRSNGSTPKPAQTQTPTEEKQDKTTETANTPTTSTPSQTTPAAGTSTKSTEMDPVVALEKQLGAALLADPLVRNDKNLKKKLKAALADTDEEDGTSSVSSVSLLSDNEEGGEARENSERRWTLVDIPDKDADQPKAQPSSSSAQAATPATPPSVPEVPSASSARNVPVKPIDYEQLGIALKQHLEAEKQAAKSSSSSTPPASKEATPSPKMTIPLPAAPIPAPQPAVVVPTSTFSNRPHVNHAVHAMMAMGFSNEGGWLAQLLESVNGDIPRALDLLTPHKINP
uniref:ZZ-type domain-containing protein n=1 Tax=Culex tarsalis TaxID=7177 RepID=A0A1Q3FEN2_CULTA